MTMMRYPLLIPHPIQLMPQVVDHPNDHRFSQLLGQQSIPLTFRRVLQQIILLHNQQDILQTDPQLTRHQIQHPILQLNRLIFQHLNQPHIPLPIQLLVQATTQLLFRHHTPLMLHQASPQSLPHLTPPSIRLCFQRPLHRKRRLLNLLLPLHAIQHSLPPLIQP
jgi:hypothetical protein